MDIIRFECNCWFFRFFFIFIWPHWLCSILFTFCLLSVLMLYFVRAGYIVRCWWVFANYFGVWTGSICSCFRVPLMPNTKTSAHSNIRIYRGTFHAYQSNSTQRMNGIPFFYSDYYNCGLYSTCWDHWENIFRNRQELDCQKCQRHRENWLLWHICIASGFLFGKCNELVWF